MPTWLRELAATVGTFDRSALEPGFALRCTIDAFITGFTSLQGIYRTRLAAVLVAALGMAVTSFVGALAAHSTAATIAVTALAGYACGTIGQIGPAAATVALNSFVAFVLFSSQPLSPQAATQQSVLVLAGGLIQALLLLVAWPVERRGAERDALADVYRRLAEYARGIETNAHAIPPITPLATARQVLADPQPFARASEMARLNRLLEDSEIIRKRLGALAATSPARALDPLPAQVAGQLDAVADALRGRTPAAPPAEAASMLGTGRLPRLHLLSKPRPGPYVKNHIDWLSRESLRFVAVLAIAMAIGRHFAADRGYWIPLTAALVLKPDFQTTFVRGVARIGGTLVGAVVASGVIVLVRAHPPLQLAGIIVSGGIAYLAFNPNYALFTVAITSFVVMVLGMRGLPGTTTIDERVLDTAAGGALALVGFLTFPSWERKRTRALLADLLDAQRRLAVAILRDDNVEAARNAVWRARTAVEASIDRTLHEPKRPHTIGAGRALRILAATQRFALTNVALETALDAQTLGGDASLAPVADALSATMSELAQALRDGRRARLDDRPLGPYAEAALRLARLIGVEKPHA